jgi:hypothetical protein
MGVHKVTTSRHGNDIEPTGVIHADSKRWSNDGGNSRSPSDTGMVQVGNDGLELALVQDFRDMDLFTISKYAQSASVGAPLSEIATQDPEGFLQGGLAGQSLEDIRIAFALHGASRVLTHQLVRTRQAAFKQQSQRDCWYGDMPEFRMPETIWADPELRDDWITVLREIHAVYNKSVQRDIPYEDARYILPEGTTNFILCEYSLRTFIDLYAYRGCVMFQSEMVAVMRAMRMLLVGRHNYLDRYIRISCEPIEKCTFQGRELVEGTCSFEWAREDNRTHPRKVAHK